MSLFGGYDPTNSGGSLLSPNGMITAAQPSFMTNWGMGGSTPIGTNGGIGGGLFGAGASTGALGAAKPLGLGFNMPTAQLAISGLGTIANIWAAFQQQKLAKEQFAYTKQTTDTNLNNSIKSYNTALTDRITSRAKTQGMSAADVAAYESANRLTRG